MSGPHLGVLIARPMRSENCGNVVRLFLSPFSLGCVAVTPRRPRDSGPEKPVAPRCLSEQVRQSGRVMESLNLLLEGVW